MSIRNSVKYHSRWNDLYQRIRIMKSIFTFVQEAVRNRRAHLCMRAHLENYERPSVEYYYSCKLQDDGNIFNRGTIPDSNQNGVEWTIEKYFKLPILSERDAKNP